MAADAPKPAATAKAGPTNNNPGGEAKIGGAKGPGTEPIYFNDESLIKEPEPTATAITVTSKNEIDVWHMLEDSKALLLRCTIDTKRYGAQLRKNMDGSLLEMGNSIASMHTYAVLHDRDKVETVWTAAADKAQLTLERARLQVDEFHQDYYLMQKDQLIVKKLLAKADNGIQRPAEASSQFESNQKELFFAEKKIVKFTDFFNDYVRQFNEMAAKKEDKVTTLIKEHEELHRP
jgi:hypothetical protein